MTRDQFEINAIRTGVPQHMIDGLWLYVTEGIEPGGFMMAVLENNLMEACGRADIVNRHSLFEICTFLYNYMPAQCKGSPEKVTAWLSMMREVRSK